MVSSRMGMGDLAWNLKMDTTPQGEKQIPPPRAARERILRVGMTFLVLRRGGMRHD